MKKYNISDNNMETAIKKMKSAPYSLNGDCISYRVGYIRALQDIGIIDGLSASRMTMEIVEMKGWQEI